MPTKILVIGGAGYIGSHAILSLLDEESYDLAVFDNLSRGHADVIGKLPFFLGDLRNFLDISTAIEKFSPDVIMHFAALAYVGESMENPEIYYQNNVIGSLNLLNAMKQFNVTKLVFSSTCTVYGEPEAIPILESHITRPINAYGKTKLLIEFAVQDYCLAYGFSSIILRYFNAAGADKLGRASERHIPETHLIPLILQEAIRTRLGGDPAMTSLSIFGNDYETEDGTCIRDYVHVTDIGAAHSLAAKKILESNLPIFDIYNLGSGKGYSVLQVIETARKLTGQPIYYKKEMRRLGDPAVLVASPIKAIGTLKWESKFQNLEDIILTAWSALLKHHYGVSCE